MTLIFLVSLLAGCRMLADGPGGGGSGAPGAKPDDPVAASPDPSGPQGPAGDEARREEPNPNVVDEHGAAIDHFRIGPDGRTLVVYWWGGTPSCFALKEIAVDGRDGTPVISVLEGTLPEAVGRACTMEAVLKSSLVVLERPILVDASGNQHPRGEPMLGEGATEVSPRADLADLRQIAVTGYRLSGDGTRLEVHYVGGAEQCYGLARATAVPGEGAGLTVTVAEAGLPGVSGPCEDIGVLKFTTLRLDEPLIVHAAFGA